METFRQSVVNLVSYLNISKSSRLSPAAAGEPMRAGDLPPPKPPKKSRPASSRRGRGPCEMTSWRRGSGSGERAGHCLQGGQPAAAGEPEQAGEQPLRKRQGRELASACKAGNLPPKPPGRENKPARPGQLAAASGAARKKRAGSPLADLLEEQAADGHAALTQQTTTASPSGSP